jgi:hypothetical protein|tara:strand:- start:14 stop:325 length:312 start_codon:yes stop_codon:yes gene_type:complete
MRYTWKNGEDAELFRIVSFFCGDNMGNWKGPLLKQAFALYKERYNPNGTDGALMQRINYAREKQSASYYRGKSSMILSFNEVMCGLLAAGIVKYPDISVRLNG